MLTNENLFKIGYFDAYFMGKTDTDIMQFTDEQFESYRKGYYSGIDQYAKDYIVKDAS